MEMSLKNVRELLSGSPPVESFFMVGQAYMIRTVTHYYTGRIDKINAGELLLSDAAWIPDTGRYSDSVKSGTLSEIEPIVGLLILSRGAIVDATPWGFPLPRGVK